MRSYAEDVESYLSTLPADRQADMHKLRALMLEHLPPGYEEVMNWGMISYQVPLAVFPNTYNGQPLMYAALASQKNHMSLYLTSLYADELNRKEFEKAYLDSGKRLDAGKSCLRFRKLDDLPLPLITRTIASTPPKEFIRLVQKARGNRRKSR
jgi:hypothetical protein